MTRLQDRRSVKGKVVALAFICVAVLVSTYALFFTNDQRPGPLRVGYLPIYVDLPLFVAEENGLFRKHGVSVELSRFASSPDMGASLLSGGIDAAASMAYSVALTTESRDPGRLKIFVVDSETPENYLSSFVVLRDSNISTLKDLRGKRVGSFPGPTAVTFAKMVLETEGLVPDSDLEIIELDSSIHLSALEARTVDALFTYEPIGTQAVLEKNAIKLLPGAVEQRIINPWQAGVWVLSRDYMSAQSDQSRRFIAAIYEAIDIIRSDPEGAKVALTKFTAIKPAVASATPNIPFAKLTEVDLVAFQKHADILRDRKIISKTINASALLIDRKWVPDGGK